MRLPSLILWSVGMTAASGLLHGDVIIGDDFSDTPAGTLATSYLVEHWRARVHTGVEQGRVALVREAGNAFLRVTYPAGQISPPNSGAQWNTLFRHKAAEAVAEYRVRFDPEFDWTEGGKLPGLTGGAMPTGGQPNPDGFTSRYMWRRDGTLVVYLYHSEQKGRFGDDVLLGKNLLKPGRWHTLKQRVKLNTPGERDGVLQVWVDGELLLDLADMRWRREGQTWLIDHFLFSTFHGGSSDKYRPKRTNHVDFDDFTVTTVR